MPRYETDLPKYLIDLAKDSGFEPTVLVPSAVGVPVDTGVSDEVSERETESLFVESERLAELAD